MSEPVKITAAAGQDVRLALLLGQFHEMDISLRCLEISGTGVTIVFETAKQNEVGPAGTNDNGWVAMTSGSFTMTAAGTTLVHLTNPLKFVRYNITGIGGGACTLMIQGVARTL